MRHFILLFLAITLLRSQAFAGSIKLGIQLMNAVDRGSGIDVSDALDRGANVNYNYGSPLWRSIEKSTNEENSGIYRDIAKILLFEGAEPNLNQYASSWTQWIGSWLGWRQVHSFDLANRKGGFPELLVVFGGSTGSKTIAEVMRDSQRSVFQDFLKAHPLVWAALTLSEAELETHLSRLSFSKEDKTLALAFAAGQGLSNSVRVLLAQGALPDAPIKNIGLTTVQVLSGVYKRSSKLPEVALSNYARIHSQLDGFDCERTHSEFEALSCGFYKRYWGLNFIDSVRINDQDFNIQTVDPALAKALVIYSGTVAGKELIQELQQAPNYSQLLEQQILIQNSDESFMVLETDILEHLPERVVDRISTHFPEYQAAGDIRWIDEGKLNSAWKERPFSLEIKNRINDLATQIEDKISQLNKENGGYFIHPAHLDRSGAREIWIYSIAHDRASMKAILKSIQNHDEQIFIRAMVDFATGYPLSTEGAKASFIRAFSALYVTHSFPSEGSARSFMHFILRCGHLH